MAENEKICCLYKIAGSSDSVELFQLLQDKDKVVIGRSDECDLSLPCPKLSRRHAEMEQIEPRVWKITDLGSTNGVWINGEKLKNCQSYVLQDRDKLELGKDPSGNKPAQFIFQFYKSARVRKRPLSDKNNPECLKLQKMEKILQEKQEEEERMKRRFEELENMLKEKDVQRGKFSEMENKLKQCEKENEGRLKQLEEELLKKEELNRQRLRKMEEEQKLMEEQIKEKEMSAQEREKALQEQMTKAEQERTSLEEERRATAQQLQQELMSAQERENTLQEQMQRAEIEWVIMEEERKTTAKQLQQELEKKEHMAKQEEILQQQIVQMQAEKQLYSFQMQAEKEKIAETLSTEFSEKMAEKEQEQNRLKAELKQLMEDHRKKEADLRTQGIEVKETIEEMMESELVCAICSELFVQAVSLNCSHSYCQLCINQWCKTKKECPQCRSPITSQVRSLVLDNYINRVSEFLSEQIKENRLKVIADRKEEQKQWDAKEAAARRGVPLQVIQSNVLPFSPDIQYIVIDDSDLPTNLPMILNSLPFLAAAPQVRPQNHQAQVRPQNRQAQVRPQNRQAQVRPQNHQAQVRPYQMQARPYQAQARPRMNASATNQVRGQHSNTRPNPQLNSILGQAPNIRGMTHGRTQLPHPFR